MQKSQIQQKSGNRKQQEDMQNEELSIQQSEQESQYSSQDQDGKLLTNKVQEKLLTFVAKLKNKDPTLYNINKPIFQDDDFQQRRELGNQNNIKNKNKMTYKDLVTRKDKGQSQSSESQEGNESEKKQIGLKEIKQNLKKKLSHRSKDQSDKIQEQELFKIKKKIELPKRTEQEKLKQFVQKFDKQSSQLLTNLWKNQNQKLDKTDIFLRNYILNQKWKASKFKSLEQEIEKQKMVDEEDQVRSVQMDEYQAQYNFRFQQPGSDKIIQYPRQIPESMRVKPETRKEKRSKLSERKKIEQEEIRKEAETKKQQKKQEIIRKLQQEGNQKMVEENNQQGSLDFEHDWFFCDDCTKPLEQKEQYYMCNQCGEYMLCQQCYQLIIHKHRMQTAVIPIGAGPPESSKAEKSLKKLKSCKACRRKIPHYEPYYSYSQRSSQVTEIMCQKCYDESSLQLKKKFKLSQAQKRNRNYEELFDKDPEKIKELTTQKDIQELVDQYLKYDFQDIIGGGFKTKFKYINVKPQGYGLSDQQILYGDDKELNKYVSIKKFGAYEDQSLKLRNNMYKRKIKFINKSANENKKLLNKMSGNAKGVRTIKKIQTRAQILKRRRQGRNKKLRIINISNPENEKKYLIPKSRLESYGFTIQKKQEAKKLE